MKQNKANPLQMTFLPEADAAEKSSLSPLLDFDLEVYRSGFGKIAGLDEAGRGPLAGPVVAAACIIPQGLFIADVDDSKKLSPKKRREVYVRLLAEKQIAYGIGCIDVEQIDRINIFQATIQAMLLAVDGLAIKPDLLLVDGLQLPHQVIPSRKVIGGDALSQCIAAASVLAKETRDQKMLEYHEQWPFYGFDQHKGYGTKQHLSAIAKHGPCPIHRMSFKPLKSLFSKGKLVTES